MLRGLRIALQNERVGADTADGENGDSAEEGGPQPAAGRRWREGAGRHRLIVGQHGRSPVRRSIRRRLRT